MLQLLTLYQTIAIDVVDFEEKFDFILGRLTRKLGDRVDELVQ